ncbi:hypothetical protein [Thalassomonas haliotis]|uniref:Uncharacterized protein n=1 Tax=Thalassomonas haliotis TaxID=485448 RepID=A0ABY7VEM4_9GAMM|nr:hypothetical protein [Thalassomonas haliotis]WDE12016.1 hypothetical protein H3N35_00550 [Thalassomonas haliotis]
MMIINLIAAAFQKRKTTLDLLGETKHLTLSLEDVKEVAAGSGTDNGTKPRVLAAGEVNSIVGGSSGQNGIKPNTLMIDELKAVSGGSGGHNGPDPKAVAFVAPMADSFSPQKKDENKITP